MKIQVVLDLTPEEFQAIWRTASRRMNYKREDPQKAWTASERKDVIRQWILLQVFNGIISSND